MDIHPLLWKPNKPEQLGLKTAYAMIIDCASLEKTKSPWLGMNYHATKIGAVGLILNGFYILKIDEN